LKLFPHLKGRYLLLNLGNGFLQLAEGI